MKPDINSVEVHPQLSHTRRMGRWFSVSSKHSFGDQLTNTLATMAMAAVVPSPIARAPVHNGEHQSEILFYFFCKTNLDHMGGHMKGSETRLFSTPWDILGGKNTYFL